ncbi:hypothetical protein [Agarivorans sp. DSG3-1]|uniref:hypothetical protein n=1 Tax=Agarivorans sp. DSG3-1 TaxID=3342249 RepID=UPI00398ECB72
MSKKRKGRKNTASPKRKTERPPQKKRSLAQKLGIVAIISCVGALYPLFKDYIASYKDEGLVVNLYNNQFPLSENTPTYIVYAQPSDQRQANHLIPLRLSIKNKASYADENVLVSLSYEKESRRFDIGNTVFTQITENRFSDQVQREVTKLGSKDVSRINYVYLPQLREEKFVEVGLTHSATFEELEGYVMASGQGLDVTIRTASHKDKDRSWPVRYRGLELNDTDGMLWWMENWYSKSLAIELRNEMSFWQYLLKLVSSEEVQVYGVEFDFAYHDQLKAYIPKTEHSRLIGARFAPYSIDLLFN